MKLKRICPICGGTSADFLCEISFAPICEENLPNTFNIVACSTCHFVFDDLDITQKDLDDYYAHTIKYQHPNAWGNGGYSADSLERYRDIVDFVRPYLDECHSFLDVGAGKGGLLHSVKDVCGCDKIFTAVEPSMRFIKEHNGIYFYPFLEEILESNTYYDFIFCTHVMEHVFDLQSFVKKISDVSKDGKYVYIEVPNAAAYFKGHKAPFYYFDREHINHFTIHSLKNLFFQYGFKMLFSFETQSIGIIFQKTNETVCCNHNFDCGYSAIVDYVEQSKQLDTIDYYSDITKFPVLCWGMGAHLRRIFLKHNFPNPISAIIDRDRGGHGESWNGIPLVTSDILLDDQYALSSVLITSVLWETEIRKQIAKMNFKGNVFTAF